MKNSSVLIAFISAFSLHIILGGLLLMGVDFSLPKEKPKAVIIEASAISQTLFDDLAQRKKEKIQAEQRRKELLRKEKARIEQEKKQAEEKRRKIEAERIQAEKAEVLRKKREVERIQAEKVLAAKRLEEEKRAEDDRQKRVQEKLKKEAEERVKAEKVAKAKAVKEKAEKIAREKAAQEQEKQRQAELDKQMEAEFADEFSNAKSAKQLSEMARYKALIQNKISRNWQVGANMKGLSCTLAIRLAPDGLVLSVKRSSGDEQLCESAKRATLSAKTLPIPKDPEIAPEFRDFDITLIPDL